jgi:thiosulfate dehydrogenase
MHYRTSRFLFLFISLVIFSSCNQRRPQQELPPSISVSEEWSAPDTNSIPNNEAGQLIKYGRDLVMHTSHYLGPNGTIAHISNGMNCQNCHLDAGTRKWGNNYSAVASTYPKYRARSGSIEPIEKRVNDCLERSLNGHVIDSSSNEMRAIVAYIKWVGKDVSKDSVPKSAGIFKVPLLEGKPNTSGGEEVYKMKCVSCHGYDGQGKRDTTSNYYLYPPLWGDHSYTTGAGMYRLSRLAGYVRMNMPLNATYENRLTDEDAWNVAAFISSMPRPVKVFKSDWPKLTEKPFDYPFGPYADTFPEVQHKFGPWQRIIAAQRK